MAEAHPGWAALIREVADFPTPGVRFKDITPVLADAAAFAEVVAQLAAAGRDETGRVVVDKVAGIEARGFILAAPVAFALGAGLVPVRKAGRLPGETLRQGYSLEYADAELEITADAFAAGERVLLVDDVLATGGTVHAAGDLVRRSGARVAAVAVMLELAAFDGRSRAVEADSALTALVRC